MKTSPFIRVVHFWFHLKSCTFHFCINKCKIDREWPKPRGRHKWHFQSCSSPANLPAQKVKLPQPLPSEGHQEVINTCCMLSVTAKQATCCLLWSLCVQVIITRASLHPGNLQTSCERKIKEKKGSQIRMLAFSAPLPCQSMDVHFVVSASQCVRQEMTICPLKAVLGFL